jgi:hypothetical protein
MNTERFEKENIMKAQIFIATMLIAGITSAITYPIVDTGQALYYNNHGAIDAPESGQPYYGQAAQYTANAPSYKDNGDGTVFDLVSGLMWMQDSGEKKTYDEAVKGASSCKVGGHTDWRLPTIKELYSLIQLDGTDPDPRSSDTSKLKPFIDDSVFKFQYGKEENGERIIDYTRSPDTTGPAAIDPIFDATEITNEGGEKDYAHYWTSSSHPSARGADTAVYFALGWMPDRRTGDRILMDVHRAGAQRSDPKEGSAERFPYGRGPQGDVIRIDNMVRCVRGGP